MPRILLVGNYKLDRQYSMLGLLACLRERLPAHRVRTSVLQPRQRLGGRGGRLEKWLRYVDKFVLFPRELEREAAKNSLVHVLDQGNAVYLKSCAQRPAVLTCHDLLPLAASRGEIPGWQVKATGARLHEANRHAIAGADLVACVSEFSFSEARRLVPEVAERLRLVRNGLYRPVIEPSSEMCARYLAKTGLQPGFLFNIGNDSPYKNRAGLARIVAALAQREGFQDVRLVLAGKRQSPFLEALYREVGVEPRTRVLVEPTDEEVAVLYRSASALVFPSILEGFGLPLLEAFAARCPVFASDRPPLPEVGGDAARYFDPDDPESAATVIAERWGEREQMKEEGRRRLAVFSTDKMVEGYVRLYHEALA